MKANTTKQYLYTGDLYGYTLVTSADGSVTEKVYDEVPTEVKMALSVSIFGELLIESQSKMQINSILRNILDANNEEIYDGGGWQINQTAPILGPNGLKDGYRYRAVLFEGII
jgi:hypothetical protein